MTPFPFLNRVHKISFYYMGYERTQHLYIYLPHMAMHSNTMFSIHLPTEGSLRCQLFFIQVLALFGFCLAQPS